MSLVIVCKPAGPPSCASSPIRPTQAVKAPRPAGWHAAATVPATVEWLETPVLTRPEWLSFDDNERSASVTRVPQADEAPFPVKVQHMVEYHAVRL